MNYASRYTTSTQASSPNPAIVFLTLATFCLSLMELYFNRLTLTFGSCLLFMCIILLVKLSESKVCDQQAATSCAQNGAANTTRAAGLRALLAPLHNCWHKQGSAPARRLSLLELHVPHSAGSQEINNNRQTNRQPKAQQIETSLSSENQTTVITSLVNSSNKNDNVDKIDITTNNDLDIERPNSTPTAKLVAANKRRKLIILLCSTAWATALAIQRGQLLPILPIIMFINYTLLAHDNKQVFQILLLANLLHFFTYPFHNTIFAVDHSSKDDPSSLSTSSYINTNNDATQVPIILNHTTVVSQNQSTQSDRGMPSSLDDDQPNFTRRYQLWLILKLVLIFITYSIFHTIGLYLDKRNKADTEKSLADVESYVTSKIDLDNEDKKLSKLLESVIPKHLTGIMREDILQPQEMKNFYPIYLTHYDNVSILFADIVNFTKMASNCTAHELVENLNELFGRFDKAADSRQCLRIKILGDCYYCVSGIPDQGQSHASQCVEMGLDMIDILNDLARGGDNQGVDLNMRVGIHTGSVLCGILGKKRWQFDVHSNDVKLANHMEQSGVPGRVHITADTLDALNGRYAVEQANGHLRDPYIAFFGIATYFVIPPPERRRNSLSSSKLVGLGSCVSQTSAASVPITIGSPSSFGASRLTPPGEATTQQAICDDFIGADNSDGTQAPPGLERVLTNNHLCAQVKSSKEGEQQQHLKHAQQHHCKTQQQQQQYERSPQGVEEASKTQSGEQRTVHNLDIKLEKPNAPDAGRQSGLAKVSATATTTASERQPNRTVAALAARQRFRQTGKKVINVLHFIDTIEAPFANLDCQPSEEIKRKMTDIAISERSQTTKINRWTLQFEHSEDRNSYMREWNWHRLVLQLLLNVCALVALLALIYSHTLSLDGYDGDNTIGLLEQSLTNSSLSTRTSTKLAIPSVIDWFELQARRREAKQTQAYLLATAFIVLFIVCLLAYMHRVELSARRDFIWRRKAADDREQMARVRDCNKFILFNLLPPHVATHFLRRREVGHMDLYSRSYNLAGVIFATVSNFNDFYTEDKGNNHGLDCLRLLNEIIFDFDLLLNDERFSAIDKIKTIGTTYMAAIGLFPDHELPLVAPGTDDRATREIAHYMRILLEYARELQLCLKVISEHSYNTFMLRVGINLGPVTAGVIGATKPQYDIWGNTVNVASRMDSTCEPNKIQVTDEVYSYLKDDPTLKFFCRGRIDVKGKGFMTTYYVEVSPMKEQ